MFSYKLCCKQMHIYKACTCIDSFVYTVWKKKTLSIILRDMYAIINTQSTQSVSENSATDIKLYGRKKMFKKALASQLSGNGVNQAGITYVYKKKKCLSLLDSNMEKKKSKSQFIIDKNWHMQYQDVSYCQLAVDASAFKRTVASNAQLLQFARGKVLYQ